ncbi:MAG: PadR family transcriptional regulator [Deltaproteobacteria bacterium]|nr:PadR family transcriptional regulator [Deltaproteobacteria bacterium]
MEVLSRADEILLLAILRLRDNAYGVSIVKEAKQRTGKTLKLGGLWVSLDILAKKGLVCKHMGDPTPARGGRSKIYYALTPSGLKALERVKEFNRSLWKGIRDVNEGYQV